MSVILYIALALSSGTHCNASSYVDQMDITYYQYLVSHCVYLLYQS